MKYLWPIPQIFPFTRPLFPKYYQKYFHSLTIVSQIFPNYFHSLVIIPQYFPQNISIHWPIFLKDSPIPQFPNISPKIFQFTGHYSPNIPQIFSFTNHYSPNVSIHRPLFPKYTPNIFIHPAIISQIFPKYFHSLAIMETSN